MSGFFQARVPASSPFQRNPKALPKTTRGTTSILFAADASTGAAFWTAFDNIGDYQTADPTAATRTIINITGAGFLRGVIGPCTNGTGSTVFYITIDGVLTTITVPNPVGNSRTCLGNLFVENTRFTTAARGGDATASTDVVARGAGNVLTSCRVIANFQVRDPSDIFEAIRFDTSCKVELALTGSALGALGSDAYCGAIWDLDG